MATRRERNEARLAAEAARDAAALQKKKTVIIVSAVVAAVVALAIAAAIILPILLQPAPTPPPEKQYVKVETSEGTFFVIETLPEYAPITATNFVNLVKQGFYDGSTFHRIVKDFVVQGGISASGTAATAIYGEFSSNGWTQNTLEHTAGVLSMARTDDPNSASSQFFICTGDARESLDGKYAGFGRVIYGMDAVMGLNEYGVDTQAGTPTKTVTMTKVTLLTPEEAAPYLK